LDPLHLYPKHFITIPQLIELDPKHFFTIVQLIKLDPKRFFTIVQQYLLINIQQVGQQHPFPCHDQLWPISEKKNLSSFLPTISNTSFYTPFFLFLFVSFYFFSFLSISSGFFLFLLVSFYFFLFVSFLTIIFYWFCFFWHYWMPVRFVRVIVPATYIQRNEVQQTKHFVILSFFLSFTLNQPPLCIILLLCTLFISFPSSHFTQSQ